MHNEPASRYAVPVVLTLGVIIGFVSPAWADGPLRGNPMDSLPVIETPGVKPGPSPRLQPPVQDAAQAALRARMQQHITPTHFNVAGNTIIPITQIAPILEPLAGKSVTIAQLTQEVARITALYQAAGYPLSFALLQNQSFAGGLVEVSIVEGHIKALRIEGEVGRAADRLQALAQPLIAEKPLTRARLERTLNLMRQVPGVRFVPRLDMPKYADGGTELVLQAEHRPLSLSGGLSDMGSGIQGIVTATANSLTPLGEQIRLTAAVPIRDRDVRYIAGKVSVPVGADGLEVELDGYHYEAHPEDRAIQALGFDRRVVNERLGLGVRYPFLLDNERSLTGEAGVYMAQSIDEYQRDQDNAWQRQRTQLRVVRMGLRYKEAGARQSREVAFNIYKGLDALGASKDLSSNFAELGVPRQALDFTRFTLDLKQSIKLPAEFGITLSGTGQYSKDILPTLEQVSFGAWRYGLGYPQGELGGDKGYGVSLELNRRFKPGWRWLTEVQPYVMLDHARAWYNADGAYPDRSRSLTSAALGVRVSDSRRYIFDINVARPLGDPPLGDDERGYRINANYSLLYDGW